ncbi:MAG TPA: hypothetical protein VG274_03590 [Rhizomicrobium sp.]|nr:hypothetical protein [Rhizomicrobium sp.]
MGEAIGFARGELDPSTYRVHVPSDVDVKAVRQKTGLSQDVFAVTYGLSAGTVRDWEQRRRAPDQAARMYLHAISKDPKGVYTIIAGDKRHTVTNRVSVAGKKKHPVSGSVKRKKAPAHAAAKASASRATRSH